MRLQVGVKVLVERGGKYLFVRRAPAFKRRAPEWDIPGGRIGVDERLLDALEREVLEETGLRLDGVERLVGAQDIFDPEKDIHVVRLTYRGTAIGEVVVSSEHEVCRWMTVEEVLGEAYVDQYVRELLSQTGV